MYLKKFIQRFLFFFLNIQTALFKLESFLTLGKNSKHTDDMLLGDNGFFLTLYEDFGREKRYCSSCL